MDQTPEVVPNKETDPEGYEAWRLKVLSDCKVIKHNVEGPEWKEYMQNVQKRLEAKRGKERLNLVEVGYRVRN